LTARRSSRAGCRPLRLDGAWWRSGAFAGGRFSDGADVDALIASAVDQTPAQSMLRRFATYIQQPITTR
jgi:hypothetical protein